MNAWYFFCFWACKLKTSIFTPILNANMILYDFIRFYRHGRLFNHIKSEMHLFGKQAKTPFLVGYLILSYLCRQPGYNNARYIIHKIKITS